MEKTKEEIIKMDTPVELADRFYTDYTEEQCKNDGLKLSSTQYHERLVDAITKRDAYYADQIKSMENYISDVDVQVKDLREEVEAKENRIFELDMLGTIAILENKEMFDKIKSLDSALKVSSELLDNANDNSKRFEAWGDKLVNDAAKLIKENDSLQSQLESLQKEINHNVLFDEQVIALQKELNECKETLPTDIAKFYVWANQKFQTDGNGSYKVVRDGCITFYSTNELYKDWKRGLL